MRPEDLVFWLDRLIDTSSDEGGVLCQRHADSMVVPRSWTLDDLRDPDLHLFRPPERVGEVRPSRRRGVTRRDGTDDEGTLGTEQLALGVDPVHDVPDPPDSTIPPNDADAPTDHQDALADAASAGETVETWSPTFDSADDLGGLLAAQSPLLARAFRGDDRPR